MVVFDLLIIYTDGTSHVVSDVSNYQINSKDGYFSFTKNGYNSFLPIQNVNFFGRRFDYENDKKA